MGILRNTEAESYNFSWRSSRGIKRDLCRLQSIKVGIKSDIEAGNGMKISFRDISREAV